MPRVQRRAILDLGSPMLSADARALLAPPRMHPSGYLIVEGLAARTGVQLYASGDGSRIIREYRPPEEVFAPESVDSWNGVPFTARHPRGLLSTRDASREARGAVLSAEALPAHGWVKARLAIHDANLIGDIQSGALSQLSAGYTAVREDEEGIAPDGQRYDSVQRGIRINHLAAVDIARAGANAQLRLDDAGELIPDDDNDATGADPQEPPMKKIKINGVVFEVADDVAAAIEAEQAHTATTQAELDAQSARLDAANTQLAEARAAKPDVAALVKAHVALVSKAKTAAPDLKLDDADDADAIMRKVVAERFPKIDLKDKGDAYIQALFDAAVESPLPPKPAKRGAGPDKGDQAPSKNDQLQDEAHKANKDREPKQINDLLKEQANNERAAYGGLFKPASASN